MNSTAATVPMLDTIAVATLTAPAPGSAFSSAHAIDPSTEVRNQAAIAEALTRANHMLQSNRAENTKKVYTPKKHL